MATPKSSIKKRGNVFYLRYSEKDVRKRVSLHTGSLHEAKEMQRKYDSARAHGENNILPTKTSPFISSKSRRLRAQILFGNMYSVMASRQKPPTGTVRFCDTCSVGRWKKAASACHRI